MVKLYEELVKLCMVCIANTILGEEFELFIKPRLRGDNKFLHYPGRGFKKGHRQMAWGRELKRGKPTPCLAGGVFITFMKTPY